MNKFQTLALFALSAIFAGSAIASPTTFANQSKFEAAFAEGSFTVVNLDDGELGKISTPDTVMSDTMESVFQELGFNFSGNDARVVDGQSYQIIRADRDRLIVFGESRGGQLVLNFSHPVNGIGWTSNQGDGGRVVAYSGADLSGENIGTGHVKSGSFGGIASNTLIRSATLTCDFDDDLICGAFDIQFGRFIDAQ